ncbi:hypothetical protein [Lysobacter enzymogenes]|uniref:hypothetical protein n=1 Tax=Lysobacter enzymogenes TaxID=69 RepID=UPI00089C6CA4|nr:hypothetical protein [Lysobacter enzymogenes]SDX52955.1 hypothetical protein SAMN05421681_10632 [Lysobacter enzymogenes]
MPAAAVGLAGAAISAYSQNRASKKAAGAQTAANDAAIAESRRQYDQNRQDQMPWLETGRNALARQNAFLNGDTSGFDNSADYKFAVDQGFKGLNRGLARNGALWSGGGDADRIALGQGLATQYANNYWNKLAGQAGQGQQSAQSLGAFGQNAANNVGNLLVNSGNARGSAYQQQGDTMSQLVGVAGNAVGNWLGRRNSTGFNLGGY